MTFKRMMMATAAIASVAQAGGLWAAEIPTLPGPQTTERVYGNGASLPAPYFRQAADCYSLNFPLILAGNPPVYQNIDPFSFNGQPSQNCATTDYITNRQIQYLSTGSGTGILAFYSHDPARAGDTNPAPGVQLFTRINYALSETALGTNDVNVYNNGGTIPGSNPAVTVVAPGATPGTGQYANPAYNRGALIQFPILIAPVAIGYDPIYKKVRAADNSVTTYELRNRWERDDQSGGIRLDQNLVCAIFNGDVDNWNDTRFRPNNRNASFKAEADTGTFSVPLQIVGRRDSSGTTSLFTRFMANACEDYTGNSYGNSTSRLPGVYVEGSNTRTTPTLNKDLVGAVWDKNSDNFGPGRVFVNPTENGPETIGKFTVADQNDGVAKYLDFTQEPTADVGSTVVQGRIGYIGPDYVLPGVEFTGQNNFGLKTADIANATGNFRAPTSVNAFQGYKTISAPESDTAGNYVENAACTAGTAPATTKCRNRPQDWVEPADKNSPLANPSQAAAYPIVGTSNALLYSCYTRALSARVLQSFFGNYYLASLTVNDAAQGLLASSGFSPLPQSWRRAAKNTFFDAADVANLDLTISTVEAGGEAKCQPGQFGAREGG